ncbi:MAG: DNA repair protein RecO [Alphaproteobacteria bacterium]
MQWEDSGIVLRYRSYSEKQLIASIFTQHHGRVDGMVMRTKSSLPQPGDFVKLQRKARLEQHMGTLKLETKQSHSSLQFCESTRVYALKSMLEMLSTLLPENHPYEKLWQYTNETILSFYNFNEALKAYCLFEVMLVEELGFGLSLDECAVTGSSDNLSHVSPKTGRAVCYEAAKPYITKLLPLPKFLLDQNNNPITATDYVHALQLTGHFLLNHASHNRPLPIERSELLLKLKSHL